jgi:hypothetical protein
VPRDVIFDEQVFPFASLHPNAGAKLRADIILLPSYLVSPNHDGVCTTDNPSTSAVSPNQDASKNFVEEQAQNPEEISLTAHERLGDDSSAAADSMQNFVPADSELQAGAHSPAPIRSSPIRSSGAHSPAPIRSSAPIRSQPREVQPGLVDPSGSVDAVNPPVDGPPTSDGGSSVTSGSLAPTRRTQAQHGITKPKIYTDGTIRYAFTTVTGEPETLGEALEDDKWR